MGVETFLRRNYSFLLLNVLIVPVLAALTYLSILSPGLLAISVVLVNTLPKVEELRRRWRTSEHRDRVKDRTEEFNQELQSFEALFQADILDTEEYGAENLINYTESVIDPGQQIYLPLLYIYLSKKSNFELENHERTTLQKKLQTSLKGVSLVHPTEDDIRLAWGAHQLLCEASRPYTIDPPDKGFMETDCFEERFVHGFLHKEQVISELTSKHEELADYRHTLSQLYDSGKLSKFGIQQALLELEEELSYVLTDKTHYFTLINDDMKDSGVIDDIEENIISTGDDTYTGSFMVNGGMASLVLCVCDESWETKEFYEKFIKEPYERCQTDGVLSIHRAKFEGGTIFKQQYEETEPTGNILRAIKSRNLLTTGEVAATMNLREKLIESHLSTDELLSVLPLNLFLPDLPSTKKEILIEKNEKIKQKFGIQQLTDWANPNYTAEEIGQHLHQQYFPEDSEDEWVENTEKIISEAEDINQALS
ncbi:hypothetical protein [Halobacterium zhouii]|uniref:hypothetical protein n=1 Tax=Halobacterium zhouii TaxID=2902624 RepID=UPI001E53DFD4|nr:hypothetical protein [Halobacterium zhouii]